MTTDTDALLDEHQALLALERHNITFLALPVDGDLRQTLVTFGDDATRRDRATVRRALMELAQRDPRATFHVVTPRRRGDRTERITAETSPDASAGAWRAATRGPLVALEAATALVASVIAPWLLVRATVAPARLAESESLIATGLALLVATTIAIMVPLARYAVAVGDAPARYRASAHAYLWLTPALVISGFFGTFTPPLLGVQDAGAIPLEIVALGASLFYMALLAALVGLLTCLGLPAARSGRRIGTFVGILAGAWIIAAVVPAFVTAVMALGQ